MRGTWRTARGLSETVQTHKVMGIALFWKSIVYSHWGCNDPCHDQMSLCERKDVKSQNKGGGDAFLDRALRWPQFSFNAQPNFCQSSTKSSGPVNCNHHNPLGQNPMSVHASDSGSESDSSLHAITADAAKAPNDGDKNSKKRGRYVQRNSP